MGFCGAAICRAGRRFETTKKPGGREPMAYEFEGRTIESTATGYLADQDDWSRELAGAYRGPRTAHPDAAALGPYRLPSRRIFSTTTKTRRIRAQFSRRCRINGTRRSIKGRSTICFRTTRRSKADVSPACLKAAARADTETKAAVRCPGPGPAIRTKRITPHPSPLPQARPGELASHRGRIRKRMRLERESRCAR